MSWQVTGGGKSCTEICQQNSPGICAKNSRASAQRPAVRIMLTFVTINGFRNAKVRDSFFPSRLRSPHQRRNRCWFSSTDTAALTAQQAAQTHEELALGPDSRLQKCKRRWRCCNSADRALACQALAQRVCPVSVLQQGVWRFRFFLERRSQLDLASGKPWLPHAAGGSSFSAVNPGFSRNRCGATQSCLFLPSLCMTMYAAWPRCDFGHWHPLPREVCRNLA